jgi:NitT/TauT family transport system substrate-binding protein
MKINRIVHGLVVIAAGLLVVNACAADTNLARVVYLPHWIPQAQFAGYYVAKEKGIYQQYGLDVDILKGGPGMSSAEWLEEGKCDFATMFMAKALMRQDEGAPLVNIAQMVQRSALLLVTRADSGITSPDDMEGRAVSIWEEFDVQPLALFRKHGITPRLIKQGSTMNLFLRGATDVTSAMWYNGYHTLLNAGLNTNEMRVFWYDEFDLNFPEEGIYILQRTLTDRPEVCRAFVQATLEGWRYAFEHKEEALDIVMDYVNAANMPTTRVHHRWMLKAMEDIMVPSGDLRDMGRLEPDQYLNVARELKAAGLISHYPEFGVFYEECIEP